MAELVLGNRLPGGQKRIKLKDVDLKGSVPELRERVTETLGVKDTDYDMIYAGRILTDGSLESYGIKSGVTIHIIKRQIKHDRGEPEPFDPSTLPMLLTALQAALLNPAHSQLVTKILSNKDTLENVIAATPGLEKDVVAQALIQTPELMINLANPDDAEVVLKKHPSLAHAAMMIAAAVNEEASRSGDIKNQTSMGSYSLDQMSDDDEFDDQQQSARPATGQITANQLAQALAQAGGQASANQSQQPAVITNDFFRQAIAQAMGSAGLAGPSTSGAGTSAATGSELNPQVLESQLQQLREMGITDDQAARRALQIAGGNVQMALSILFGDVNEMI